MEAATSGWDTGHTFEIQLSAVVQPLVSIKSMYDTCDLRVVTCDTGEVFDTCDTSDTSASTSGTGGTMNARDSSDKNDTSDRSDAAA